MESNGLGKAGEVKSLESSSLSPSAIRGESRVVRAKLTACITIINQSLERLKVLEEDLLRDKAVLEPPASRVRIPDPPPDTGKPIYGFFEEFYPSFSHDFTSELQFPTTAENLNKWVDYTKHLEQRLCKSEADIQKLRDEFENGRLALGQEDSRKVTQPGSNPGPSSIPSDDGSPDMSFY